MNTRKIMALHNKVEKEAQKAIDAIYKSYNKEMNDLIASEIPKGETLLSGNGQNILCDKDGNELRSGCAWATSNNDDVQLNKLAYLQYNNEFYAGFFISQEIKGTKNK